MGNRESRQGWTAEGRGGNFGAVLGRKQKCTSSITPPAPARSPRISRWKKPAPTTAPSRLDFKANQQQSPDYLKINAKGRVPALVTDKGIITENPAILAYIAQTFPKAKLAPTDDPFAFAQVQSFNSYLCGTVHVAHAHKGRGYRWATQESSFADMKGMVPKSMGACFDLIEKSMLRGRG